MSCSEPLAIKSAKRVHGTRNYVSTITIAPAAVLFQPEEYPSPTLFRVKPTSEKFSNSVEYIPDNPTSDYRLLNTSLHLYII